MGSMDGERRFRTYWSSWKVLDGSNVCVTVLKTAKCVTGCYAMFIPVTAFVCFVYPIFLKLAFIFHHALVFINLVLQQLSSL